MMQTCQDQYQYAQYHEIVSTSERDVVVQTDPSTLHKMLLSFKPVETNGKVALLRVPLQPTRERIGGVCSTGSS